jgi:hypothetical protein
VDLPGAVDVAHRGTTPALGHHGMRLAEPRLAHAGDPHPALPGLDDRMQPNPARTEHANVVGVPFHLGHLRVVLPFSWRPAQWLQKNWTSLITPPAIIRM